MKRRRRPLLEGLEGRLCLNAPQLIQNPPFQIPQDGNYVHSAYVASPIFANLDPSDPAKQELIVPAAGGRLLALKADANGNVTIWRQYSTGAFNNPPENFKSTPVVVDLPNGHKGIFASMGRDEFSEDVGNGWVFGWDALTGQVLPGWPQSQGMYFSNNFHRGTFGPLGAGDIDGDGRPEIFVTSHSTYLSAFKLDGTLLWRYENNDTIETGPVVADIDGDGKNEVVFTSGISKSFVPDGGFITVLNSDGSTRWRHYVGEVFEASPVLADLNNDGKLEIIAPGGYYFAPQGVPGARQAGNRVYALDDQGRDLPGWPYQTTAQNLDRQSYASPVVADLLGDFRLETIVLDQSGTLHVILPNGQDLPGWEGGRTALDAPDDGPPGGNKAFATPIVADVDGDGKADIVVEQGFTVVAFNRLGQKIWTHQVTTGAAQFVESLTATPAVGQWDGTGGLELAVLSTSAPDNRPSLVSLFHLDPSGLTPPWPMMRRSASAAAVRQALPYLAPYAQRVFRSLLGRESTQQEMVYNAVAMEQNQLSPAQFARNVAGSTEARGHAVDLAYRQILDRNPTPRERADFAYLLGQIRQRDMVLALLNSTEFIKKGGSVVGVIDLTYQKLVGRPASQGEIDGWINTLQATRTLRSVGDALLNTQGYIDRQAAQFYAAAFGSSVVPPDALAALEYDINHGAREADAEAAILSSGGNYASTQKLASYVRTLYRDLLMREASPAETAAIVRLFNSGGLDQANFARFLLNSPEGRALYIREQFQALLGRAPTPLELAGLGGYARREDVLRYIALTPDYLARNGGSIPGFVAAVFRDFGDIAPVPEPGFSQVVQAVTSGQMTTTALVNQLLAGPGYANKTVVADYFRYLPDETQGFLRVNPLTGDPANPTNPDPAGIAAFVRAMSLGMPSEEVIVIMVTTPKYLNGASYFKGFYRGPSLRA